MVPQKLDDVDAPSMQLFLNVELLELACVPLRTSWHIFRHIFRFGVHEGKRISRVYKMRVVARLPWLCGTKAMSKGALLCGAVGKRLVLDCSIDAT